MWIPEWVIYGGLGFLLMVIVLEYSKARDRKRALETMMPIWEEHGHSGERCAVVQCRVAAEKDAELEFVLDRLDERR